MCLKFDVYGYAGISSYQPGPLHHKHFLLSWQQYCGGGGGGVVATGLFRKSSIICDSPV